MAMDPDALSYCGREVRRHDHDRFLTALFVPADRREAVFALFAFNLEIARTREVVSEPLLGRIRLQWWRDAVDAAYGGGAVPEHPVVVPLSSAVRTHALSRRHVETLIEAREADLDDAPPATLSCLVSYAEATTAPLLWLVQEALGVRDRGGDPAAREAARHTAIAYALAGLLRAVPHHARMHRVRLPADRLAAHGGGERELLDLKPGPAVTATVAEVAAVARDHLARARALRRRVPRAALPALLPAVLAHIHLDAIGHAANDVFTARVQMPNPLRAARLGWAALRGRY